MDMMKMAPMQQNNQMQDFGMKMLQAALNQKRQQDAAVAAQPQAGQTMPGIGAPGAPAGPMNITPPQQPMGMLQKLLGGFFGQGGAGAAAGGAAAAPGGAAMMGGLGPLV